LGQEFKPTLDSLNFVDLFHVSSPVRATANFMVNIHEGAITGTLLGGSSLLTLGPELAPARFSFSDPVALIPGQL